MKLSERRQLTIASRNSPLALQQTEMVRQWLNVHHPLLHIDILALSTEGDRNLSQSLAKIGGKGLFIKELEHAMLSGTADLAVHSMKDLPMTLPDGFCIAAVSARENPCDAFISNSYAHLQALPLHAKVGTSSLRREMQLLHHYPHLTITGLRGNVGTRLKKLDDGLFDGIVLAAAGLLRLNLAHRITQILPVTQSIPAAGQGALAIECQSQRNDIIELFHGFHHLETAACITAERAVCRALDGGCHVPIASYSLHQDNKLYLTAAVGSRNGTQLLTVNVNGALEQAEDLGKEAAMQLREKGAHAILDEYNRE